MKHRSMLFALLMAGITFVAGCADDKPRGGITGPNTSGPDLSWIERRDGAFQEFNKGWIDLEGHRDVYDAWVTTARHSYNCGIEELRMKRNAESENFRLRINADAFGLPQSTGTGETYCWRGPDGKYHYAQFGAHYDKLKESEKAKVQFTPDKKNAALALYRQADGAFVVDRSKVSPEFIISYTPPANE